MIVDGRAGVPRVAAVTMTYNEPVFLPIWLRHYSREVGSRNCFVIDHGSDDGSTDDLGDATVIRLPRSPLDEFQRARFVSGFCSSLLEYYNWVLYADTDEIVFADPALHQDIRSYCHTCFMPQVSAYGFNLVHMPDEPALDLARPILPQRPWCRFTAAVSKPVLTRRPTVWCIGFHRADTPVMFGALYLMHLRYVDRTIGLQRLAKTRGQAFAHSDTAPHHRQSDDVHLHYYVHLASQPQVPAATIGPDSPHLAAAVAAAFGPPGGPETYEMTTDPDALWRVPERFMGVF